MAAINPSVLPELSNKYIPGKHDPVGWYMSEKLDGVRAWWIDGKIYSREGHVFYPPEYFIEGFPRDIILDGELYMGRGNFQTCVGTVKRHVPTEAWKKIQFVVFDAPSVSACFADRLLEAAKRIPVRNPHIRMLDQIICTDTEHVNRMLIEIENNGGEGVMLRHPMSLYNIHGKRTSNVLKVKTMHDAEAVVIGHEPGKGRHEGRLGALLCTMEDTPTKKFKIGSGFTDEERENPPEIGTVVSYRYFELTKSGIPRFPVFYRIRK
jgi:DNA ligase 1